MEESSIPKEEIKGRKAEIIKDINSATKSLKEIVDKRVQEGMKIKIII